MSLQTRYCSMGPSAESIQPSQEAIDEVKSLLSEEDALSHSEIVDMTELNSSEVKHAITELWNDNIVYHTLDRKFAIQQE